MERNVYEKPEERVLLRTADVYQTEAPDEVESYSDRLLAIVAAFENSGRPEGANAQSMVGKSKRGEVACRLFARIDPATGIIEAAGFKTRGCLAMTGCASVACSLVEGKGIEEALELTTEEVREAVDGVPPGKVNALHFSVCAVKALVGDMLLRDGADLAGLDEAVPCDEQSVSCLMAEHCSLRQSRLELRLEEEAAQRERVEDNACAAAFDLVRANTARGTLTVAADWDHLVPSHLSAAEFSAMLLARCEEEEGATEAPDPAAAALAPVSQGPERSAYADRGVGIPSLFADTVELAAMPETKRALAPEEPLSDDDFELRPPDGYELVEVDGIWGLVKTDEAAAPVHRTVDGSGIRAMHGPQTTYLYDGTVMTAAFARWAYLAQEDDPLATFVYCVREESRTYPRPMARESFANRPIEMGAEEVEAVFQRAREQEAYGDLERLEASNGDVYFYSSAHLDAEHATALAEWSSVDRYRNV